MERHLSCEEFLFSFSVYGFVPGFQIVRDVAARFSFSIFLNRGERGLTSGGQSSTSWSSLVLFVFPWKKE